MNVRVAAGAGSALSNATQQNCMPAPGATCQSGEVKKEGRKEGRKKGWVSWSSELHLPRIGTMGKQEDWGMKKRRAGLAQQGEKTAGMTWGGGGIANLERRSTGELKNGTCGEAKAEDEERMEGVHSGLTSPGGCRGKTVHLFFTLSSQSCLNRALVSRLSLRITSRKTLQTWLFLLLSSSYIFPPLLLVSSFTSVSFLLRPSSSSSLCVGGSLSATGSFSHLWR